MKKHTLIFDFDGTIADTHLFLIDIYNSYSDDYNYKKIDLEKLERYKDKNAAQIIRQLKIPILKIPAIIARAKEHYHQEIEQIKPFDGLKEAIVELKKQGRQIVSIQLKDGSVIRGAVESQTERLLKLNVGDGIINIPLSDIVSRKVEK